MFSDLMKTSTHNKIESRRLAMLKKPPPVYADIMSGSRAYESPCDDQYAEHQNNI
jgi:hypothetical protein